MTQNQYDQLIDYAEDPKVAHILVRRIEANPKALRALWAIYGIAILTASQF